MPWQLEMMVKGVKIRLNMLEQHVLTYYNEVFTYQLCNLLPILK